MAVKKVKKVEKEEEKTVVAEKPAVEMVSVRIKTGNSFTLVEFSRKVQGADFEKIAAHYARTMGGTVV